MERLDQWLHDYVSLFPFSGIVRVTRRDRVLLQRCVGKANVELGVPVTPETRFRFYSLTKPFCAIGALLLRDRGLLELEAHPSRYLPQAAYIHPRVTVRSLLNHSSGLPDFSQSGEFEDTLQFTLPVDPERLIGCMKPLPMLFEPGEGSFYCNYNFFLASLIIERLSGMPFERFMEQEVFAPLGMNAAEMDSSERLLPGRAASYDFDGDRLVAAPYTAIQWMMGAGAGTGTVEDVYRLNLAVKHRLLLSEDSWTQALTPGHGGYGLGCTVSQWHGRQRITHNGGYHGFRTLHIQLPEDDLDIILLSNCGFGNARSAFAEAVWAVLNGEDRTGEQPQMDAGFARPAGDVEDPLHPARPAAVMLPDALCREYEGRYAAGARWAQVSCLDGEWSICLNGRSRLPVYPCGEDRFFHRYIDESYRLIRDERGVSLLGMHKQG